MRNLSQPLNPDNYHLALLERGREDVRPKKLEELSGQERKVIEALRKIKSGKLRDQLAAAVRAIADEQSEPE